MRPIRVMVFVTFAAVFVVIVTIVLVSSQWLDPGNKGDVSTTLVTPTPASDIARVFDVSVDESEVGFVVKVYGLELNGVFPVTDGTITLEPVADELRVLVRLDIRVDAVETGNDQVNTLLRGVMETGDYPIAFYVATSRALVPVTEDEIMFYLDGDLEVHNVVDAHAMSVTAQLIGQEMSAVAVSELDLSRHGVEMPALAGSATIELTARLTAYEAN